MNHDRRQILTDSIKRLLRRGAYANLRKIVAKTHGADLARVFPSLTLPQQQRLFQLIQDKGKKGLIFSELPEDVLFNLINEMKIDEVVTIMEEMAGDDVADILGRLPEDLADAILKKMKKEGSEEVEGLLSYDDDTAGGIMVPDFIAVQENLTAREAIESIQKEHSEVEMPFYLYVVNEHGQLVGVSSLRQLVVVPPDTLLKSFMTTDVISVRTDTDQEEVAKLVARYDILAVPVVDEGNRLVGIVTVDDVIDIIREEATEDILKMVGAGAEFVETQSMVKSTKIRLPWLMASFAGGIAASIIIGRYEESLKSVAAIAAFIPIVLGMGGNIGTQSSTIVVRGLAMGLLSVRDVWKTVFRELGIGLMLGIVYGLFLGLVTHLKYDTLTLTAAVSSAIVCSMTVAALVGSLFPMLFARIKIDPAVATGPFVTTSIDIIAVFLYFKIATFYLGL